jgi:M6 family metalloprotease-like protein
MKRNIYLLLLISLILFVSVVYAKESTVEESQIAEDNLDFYKYPDVFYPSAEELAEQGLTLDSYIQLLKDTAPKNRNSSVSNIWGTAPLSGTIRIPVLLVQFSDRTSTLTQAQVNEKFNSSNYLNGAGVSVSKYYYKQSYGNLNIVFDVWGWQQAPNAYTYYTLNESRKQQLIPDTINLFNPSVNFAQYDNDNDGRLDGVVILYAGNQGSIGLFTKILRESTVYSVDGKYYGNTALVSEKYQSNFNYTELISHEFAHILGLPDIYSNHPAGPSSSNYGPMYGISMMATSNNNSCSTNKPLNLDGWSRYFFGWINPITLTTDSSKEINLRSVNDYPDAVILRNSNMGAREFFFVENRYRNLSDTTNLDNCLFGDGSTATSGFAIYHVDENKIEAHYPNNWINWDPDGNYYNDTTWPGITFEENYVAAFITPPNHTITDLYYYDSSQPGIKENFDENPYTGVGAIWDRTTKTYTDNSNPLIRFKSISPSYQSTMTAKMLVGEETATPTTTLYSGTYPQTTQVTLSTATPNATIYYTIDGNEPTTSSLVYTDSITLPVGAITLKAMAKKDDYYISDIMSITYTITGMVSNPIAAPSSGTVDYGTQVSLSTTTDGATIRYTLDGNDPTESSSIYSSPINITQDTTIKARAFKENWQPSEITEFNYIVNVVAAPIASQESGVLDFRTPVTLSTTTTGATIRYTIDGTEPTATSPIYNYPIYVVRQITLKAKTFKTGQEPSDTSSYDYQVKLLNPKFNIDSGSYLFTTKIILTSDVPGAQIYYTTDGSDPNDGQLYTTPLRLLEDTQLRVISKRIDYVDSDIIQKEYSISHQEQQIPTLLINPRTPRSYENFDITYITERHWEDDINFSINNMNGCTFNLRRPLLYNDGHYNYYIFENNRCIRRQQRRLTFVASNQNDLESVDTEITILDPGLTAIAVGRE